MTGITIQAEGARVYVLGQTYPLRDRLRAAGGHWDPERRAWWLGAAKREALEALLASEPQQGATATQQQPAPGLEAVVAARATYRGSSCYIAGRIVRGRTHWDDQLAEVASRDAARILLYSRDGHRQWWALRSDVTVQRAYQRPTTIRGLQEFAATVRAHGGVHPDACPNCGSTSCSTAYGRRGLCDED